MNIYLQNKTAREAGVLNEVKQPLNSEIDKLFCWNVSVVQIPEDTKDVKNIMIVKNVLTDYAIFVVNVDFNQDFFKLVEESIRNGLDSIFVNKEVVDNYFEKAGKLEFGLIKSSSIVTTLRNNVLRAFDETYMHDEFSSKNNEIGSHLLTYMFNRRSHYRQKSITYTKLMKFALNGLDFMPKHLTDGPKKGIKAYEILVTLDVGIYKITRRLIVPADITFYDLHKILIEVFDWCGYHLACFDLGGMHLDLMPDEDFGYNMMEDFKLEELLEDYNQLCWTYDFGDDWEHDIKLLKIHENYQLDEPFLLEAHFSAPPEDVGGVYGFQDFLEIINNPADEEYETYIEWCDNWKPELSEEMKKPHIIKYSKKDERIF